MREDDTSDGTSQPEVTNTVFLAAAAKNVPPGDVLWVTHFIGDPNKTRGAWAGQPYKPEHHERRDADDPSWARQNTYFAVSSIRPDADGVLARRNANLGMPLALVVDDATVENLQGTPSWVLETSPGRRQIGIFLDLLPGELARYKPLVKGMSKAGMMGQDTSGNNAVRYVRLPVGMNLKVRDTGPCKVQMQIWNPGQRMSLADAAAVFGYNLDEISADEDRPTRVDADGRERPEAGDGQAKIAGLMDDILSGASLHDPTMKLAASLVAQGLAPGATVNFIRALMENSLAPRDDRWVERLRDVPRLVRQGMEKFRREITLEAPKTRVLALSAAARGLPLVGEITEETVGMGLMLPKRTSTPARAPDAPARVPEEAQGVAPGVALQTPPEALGEPAVLMAGTCAPAPAAVPWVQPSQPVVVQVEPVRPYFKSAWEMVSNRSLTDWLIHGYLQANCISLFFGQSGSGKSFVAIDIGSAVALGREWHGHEVKQGMVVYICGEGFDGVDKRMTAYYKHHKISDAEMQAMPFYRTQKRVDITDHHKVNELAEYIAETQRMNGGGPVGLIQIDTFNRNMEGDENDAQDVSLFFVNVIELIQMRFKCHVMIIHHSGHGQDRARGSSVLRATVDQEFQVKVAGPAMVSLECKKMKDGNEPPTLVFDMKSVVVIEETDTHYEETNVVLELHGNPLDQIAVPSRDKTKTGLTYQQIIDSSKKTHVMSLKKLAVDLDVPYASLNKGFELCVKKGFLVKKKDYWEPTDVGAIMGSKDGSVLSIAQAKRKGKKTVQAQDIDPKDAEDQSEESEDSSEGGSE